MIFSTDRLLEDAWDVLSGLGLVEAEADDETLAKCEVLLARPSKITKSLMTKMKSLKVVQTMSAGVDEVDFQLIPPRVSVYSNAGAFAAPVSEHAWALLLAAAKGVAAGSRKVESYQLFGRTLLVLGCGAIGSDVARIGREAFVMKTVGVSRTFKLPEAFDSRRSLGELRTTVAEADAIVDALPLNLQTRSVLSFDILSRMRKKVVLVNVGRAETIDEASIYRLLKERPDTRFATDVFWRKRGRERFDSKLWRLPNFWATRHQAGGIGSEEVLGFAQRTAAENIRLWLATGKARNKVELAEYGRRAF